MEITPRSLEKIEDKVLASEIELLRAIEPHAIITTNYDQFLELVFPDYVPIIGQQIIRGSPVSVGEIFKIHGCVSQPGSLVFTKNRLRRIHAAKKISERKVAYLLQRASACVSWLRAGEPQYSGDLSDIDEALPETGGIIPNVYMVEWQPDLKPNLARAKTGWLQLRVQRVSVSNLS